MSVSTLQSYQLTPREDLERFVCSLDTQCEQALEYYRNLVAQRGILLEALEIAQLEPHVVAELGRTAIA